MLCVSVVCMFVGIGLDWDDAWHEDMYMYVCVYVCMCVRMCACARLCLCLYACVYVCAFVCGSVCLYACVWESSEDDVMYMYCAMLLAGVFWMDELFVGLWGCGVHAQCKDGVRVSVCAPSGRGALFSVCIFVAWVRPSGFVPMLCLFVFLFWTKPFLFFFSYAAGLGLMSWRRCVAGVRRALLTLGLGST